MNKNRFDLNLFIALDALLDTRSVSKAANRLGITQSGMSHTLGKLREEYNDPIMIRRNNSMELSSLASELAGPVKLLLQQANRLSNMSLDFDPATSKCTFRIGLEDAIQTAISVPLYEKLSYVAPSTFLHILRDGSLNDLVEGKVDLILSHHELSPPFHTEIVYNTPFVSIARKQHPNIRGNLTIEKFVECDHLVIYYEDQKLDSVEEAIDFQLAKSNLQRPKKLKVSSYIAAKKIVAETDLIAAIPASFATHYSRDAEIDVYRTPLALKSVPVYSVWHERSRFHPAHIWFRALLRNLMRMEHKDISYS